MGVLGVQIVITMVTASIMTKVGPFMSFARWILTSSGLVRYMHPSDEELKPMAILPPQTRKKGPIYKKDRNGQGTNGGGIFDNTFYVPKQNDLQLETTQVTLADVVQLRFFTEYQWLLDFSLYAVFVYFITEVYILFFPTRSAQEVDLSMVWCALAVGFAYKILISLNSLYFGGEETGERSLVICMGFAYLLLSMLVLIVNENTLETGLDEAYASFNESAASFLAENTGLESSGPASKLVLKFFLALWCGSIGALFTFPGLRMARMQWDVLSYTDNKFVTIVLNTAFVSPLFLTIMWIKPLSRDYLTSRTFKGMSAPLLTSDQFETLRLFMVIFVVIFRLAVMPRYLQSYLNMAYTKLEELKQEAGKVSNLELQKMIARVFYYTTVVTLQYVAPLVMILFLSLMYKTMGGGSWTGLWAAEGAQGKTPWGPEQQPPVRIELEPLPQIKIDPHFGNEEDVDQLSGQVSLAWNSIKHVFTAKIFRGLFGFSTWWCCLTLFTSSAIGISYQSYFSTMKRD